MVPVMLARSKTATGMAWRSDTRLPMSTMALTVGMSPRWESLRSSASAVLRHRVGLVPNSLKTRRHAATWGRSAIAVASSLSEAACCYARYSSGSSGGLGPLESPVAWITPARIVGYRSVIASS